jgi:hypothetical protein
MYKAKARPVAKSTVRMYVRTYVRNADLVASRYTVAVTLFALHHGICFARFTVLFLEKVRECGLGLFFSCLNAP